MWRLDLDKLPRIPLNELRVEGEDFKERAATNILKKAHEEKKELCIETDEDAHCLIDCVCVWIKY